MKAYIRFMIVFTLMLLMGCTIELKTSDGISHSNDGYQKYDDSYVAEPFYYDWDCWDSQYSYNSIIEVEAVDCEAYDIEVIIEHWDYNREYSYMEYYYDCDWYDTIQVQGYECSEIYDVTVIAYY